MNAVRRPSRRRWASRGRGDDMRKIIQAGWTSSLDQVRGVVESSVEGAVEGAGEASIEVASELGT